MRAVWVVPVLLLAGCATTEPTPPGEVYPVDQRQAAPELEGELVGGGAFVPVDGAVTVVNFWGSWCAPCRVEVPELQEVADANPDVEVVGVDLRDQEELAQAFLDDRGIGYPSIHDPAAELASAFGAWPISRTPSTVLIDTEGRVAAAYPGPVTAEELQAALDLLE